METTIDILGPLKFRSSALVHLVLTMLVDEPEGLPYMVVLGHCDDHAVWSEKTITGTISDLENFGAVWRKGPRARRGAGGRYTSDRTTLRLTVFGRAWLGETVLVPAPLPDRWVPDVVVRLGSGNAGCHYCAEGSHLLCLAPLADEFGPTTCCDGSLDLDDDPLDRCDRCRAGEHTACEEPDVAAGMCCCGSVALFVAAADTSALIATLPPAARCRRERPHEPHRHELAFADLIGGYWCDGSEELP